VINGKKILSVITARKGSKGIPGKNFRELMGIPLFMWSVYASISSKYVDKTVISSNCGECHEIFLSFLHARSGSLIRPPAALP
jgi:CMP-N-acetylneuraminic acid synthetase